MRELGEAGIGWTVAQRAALLKSLQGEKSPSGTLKASLERQ